MVDDSAQLYTIEGFAAASIIVLSIYLVLSMTTVFTPGDSHIAEMQLEQVGNDVLAIMDTPVTEGDDSLLKTLIETNDVSGFNATFLDNIQRVTGSSETLPSEIRYNATVYYRDEDYGTIENFSFGSYGEHIAREPSIRVTRLVKLDQQAASVPHMDHRHQVVLLEVLLWRG